MSKIRCDAKLLNLSPERQALVFEWCHEPPRYEEAEDGEERTLIEPGGLAYGRKMCWSEFAMRVSTRALSEFCSWYSLKVEFEQAESTAATAEAMMREFDPSAADKAAAFGQFIFTQQAIARQDRKAFVALEQLALDKKTAEFKGKAKLEDQRLAREKFEKEFCEGYLKWYGVKKARSIAESNLSNADKIAALRQTFFADVDAAAASGKVVLPPR